MPGINEINLIPEEILNKNMISQRIKMGGIALGCLAVLLCVAGIGYWGYVMGLEKKVDTFRGYGNQMKGLEKALASKSQHIKQLLEKREDLLSVTGKNFSIPIFFSLTRAINPETKIIKLCMEKRVTKKKDGKIAIGFDLKAWGLSRSFQDLSNFLVNLEKQDYFRDVTLVRSDRDEKGENVIDFEISFHYAEGSDA
ncbi:MAG: PilN domain-containing protein [Deltaproteobacteria bacterium]|nr:PilN domain-containing protein [Deltaproteobacteria bacterium]